MTVILYGYTPSVYAWIARVALAEKGVDYSWREVNPFAATVPAEYLALHPFKRVPVLLADGFALYETAAITRYVDEAFPGSSLLPDEARARARVAQVMGIIDSYAYWPLVRQVFGQGVFGPRIGRVCDEQDVLRGLDAAPRVLDELARLAGDGAWLVGDAVTLADIHAAPMVAYFSMHPAGMALLRERARLVRWWGAVQAWPAFRQTRPQLPDG